MKSEDNATSQAQSVDGAIEHMGIFVGGELVRGGVANDKDLVWAYGGAPSA